MRNNLKGKAKQAAARETIKARALFRMLPIGRKANSPENVRKALNILGKIGVE